MHALASGDPLDSRFVLIRPLGRGGMAEVWLVRDNELGEEVAAKIIPPGATEETVALLRRECQNARRLSHPNIVRVNIVRVFDFHRGENRNFITMAFVEGEDLTALRCAPPREILRALIPVAEAVGHAHRNGVVHRDLKAANVVRDAAGLPHVLDFGIAAVLAACDEQLEISGGGTRNAMSPQQLDGEKPGPADDIYALGALLHELIAGRPPLGPAATDEQIRSGQPEPLTSHHPLPERLRALVARMVAKSADERPRDMDEVGTELEAILEELEQTTPGEPPAQGKVRLTPPPRMVPVQAVTPRSATTSTKPPRAVDGQRRRHALIAAALIVPLLLVAALVLLVLPRWVEKARGSEPSPTPIQDAAAPPNSVPIDQEDLPETPVPEVSPPDDPEPPAVQPDPQEAEVPNEVLAPPDAGANDDAFAVSMSEGLAALERDDHDAAHEAFSRAGRMRPGSPEVAEGLLRVRQGRALVAILAYREEAAAAEAREDWHTAADRHGEILKLDPTIRFAQEGHERSLRRAKLADSIDYHLTHPGRLSSEEVFEEALELLVEASEIEGFGPLHRQRVEALDGLIDAAGTPLPVVLVSDAETQVLVYKVGRMGAFERREFELRPGVYTVVGSRPGYRDVRRTLVVEAGNPPPPLTVVCEEPI